MGQTVAGVAGLPGNLASLEGLHYLEFKNKVLFRESIKHLSNLYNMACPELHYMA